MHCSISGKGPGRWTAKGSRNWAMLDSTGILSVSLWKHFSGRLRTLTVCLLDVASGAGRKQTQKVEEDETEELSSSSFQTSC
ncbi:unnamed protein product [Urochloa humidicola]